MMPGLGRFTTWQYMELLLPAVTCRLAIAGSFVPQGFYGIEAGGFSGWEVSENNSDRNGIVPTLKSKFPLINGLVWFDINKETDWRISSSPESEAAFIEMAADPYFNP